MARAQQQELSVVPASPPPSVNEGGAILAMMDKIAAMPDVPVERLEQMFNLHQRVQADQARKEWASAFALVMQEIAPIARDAYNEHAKKKYATHGAIDAALRPIYTKHGFGPTFTTERSDQPDHIKIVGFLVHTSGHERRYEIDMPSDGKGARGGDAMTKTHAAGSAMTYGKRYLLIDMFNIPLTDDDGKKAGDDGALVSDEQQERLKALLAEIDGEPAKFLAVAKAESFEAIKVSQFADLEKRLLKAKEKRS